MATATATGKNLFFVYCPDYTDAECMTRRMAVRAKHLQEAAPIIASGWAKVAGGLITEDSLVQGADKKFLGSAFIVQADNIAEVRQRMESDVYWTGNVWDKEKLVITVFLAATSFPSVS